MIEKPKQDASGRTEPVVAEDACPPWCVHDDAGEEHAHVSDVLRAGPADRAVTARLVQHAGEEPQMLVDGRVLPLEDVAGLTRGLQRLLAQAQLAPAGFGFVEQLWRGSVATLSEIAEVADLDVAWVRAQHAGRQMLTEHEFDRLALAVAALAVSSTAAS